MTTYKLKRAVRNPWGDGRHRHDWRYTKEWPAGTEFVIREELWRDGTRHRTVLQVGHQYRVSDHAVIDAILEHAVPIEESVLALLTRLEVTSYHARPFYEFLIRSGRMTAAEFEAAWNAWHNEPQQFVGLHRERRTMKMRVHVDEDEHTLCGHTNAEQPFIDNLCRRCQAMIDKLLVEVQELRDENRALRDDVRHLQRRGR